jgi:hypothetical protein
MNRAPQLVEALNPTAAIEIFDQLEVPVDNRETVLSRLEALLRTARVAEADHRKNSKGDFVEKIPRVQRNKFVKIAKKLEKIADEVLEIEVPRRRFRSNPETRFNIREPGNIAIRNAIAEKFKEILDPRFIAEHGCRPAIWSETDDAKRALNVENMALAISIQAIDIGASILRAMSESYLKAAQNLKANTKSGGPRPDPVRDLILLNIPQLWHDAFKGERSLYFDDAHPELLDFTRRVCELFGVRSMASRHHLTVAIAKFNERGERITA